MARILVVDDEQKMRHLLAMMISRHDHQVEQAADGAEALKKIDENAYDMVISDIKMPQMDGMALLAQVQARDLSCPMVFITAFATVDSAVAAMRRGAVDYITKPFEEQRILLTIERTLKLSRVLAENRELKNELQKIVGGYEIIYESDEMKQTMNLAARVAQSDSAVLLAGESGTGKELLARFIHSASPRSKGRFVPVNCAAISASLVESELFGHEKGAFTSADRRSQGKFEFASGGTLFLDEIGDLPLDAQAKLLRALQEKQIQRVGGNEEIDVDVRVVCATNQNLEQMVETSDFRRDLYFRINVFPINPPPLRDRPRDIIPLANYFLAQSGGEKVVGLTDGAKRMLCTYRWPGNVRELANVIERSIILSQDQGGITSDTLSFLKMGPVDACDNDQFKLPAEGISLEQLELDLVRQALAATNNNQTSAANLLGLTRAKFRVLMKQLYKQR